MSIKGRRGDNEGSKVRREGAKGEGGESERQQWEKAKRLVGTVERSDVDVPYSGAVEFACRVGISKIHRTEQRETTHKAVNSFDGSSFDGVLVIAIDFDPPEL